MNRTETSHKIYLLTIRFYSSSLGCALPVTNSAQPIFSDSTCPRIAFLSWTFSDEVSPMLITKASIFVEKKSLDAIPENESLMICVSRDNVGSDKFCLK